MHREIGHIQFLPKNILNYGTGGNPDIAANALQNWLRRADIPRPRASHGP
jgi:hypothetical protein